MVSRRMRQGALRVAALAGLELTVYKFSLEIEGMLTALFKECSGLTGEIAIETYQEGGLNAYEHKLPGRTSYGNVTFKGGVAAASEMWDWFNDVSMGIVERKNVSVIMHWQGGLEAMRWNLEAAFPVSWEGPNFAAGQADTTLQTLQLAHQGISLGI